MTKQLLKMAFLLLALVGGASFAWADASTATIDFGNAGYTDLVGITFSDGTSTTGSLVDATLGGSETKAYSSSYSKKGLSTTFTTSSIYSNISGISFYVSTSDKGKTYITIEVCPNSDFSSSVTTVQAEAVMNGGGLPSNVGNNNQYYQETYSLSPSVSGYVRIKVSEGSGSSGKTINVGKIVITYTPAAAYAPTITTQPSSAAYAVGATPADLTVVASASAGVLSYQWYKNTDQDKTAKEADKIAGATSATLDKANISTASENTTYYYVVVTDDNGSTTSDLATITVVEQEPYATPTITEKNGTVQITSSDDIKVSQIKYSLDGGSSWNTYSIPFNLATPTTVKAKVVQGEDPSYTDSEVASTACNAIPAKIDGSFSITLYNDDSNWTKTASSSKTDTWTGKAATYLNGYIIALDNEGQEGSNIKELSTGNAINGKSTIKGSNGRRIKFTIPTGVKVNRITIYSYTNGDSNNKYASTWSFDGETPDMIGLSLRDNDENNGKSESSASNPDIRVFYFDTPLEGSFYLNNSGYQQCFYMVLDYTQTFSATITSSGYASFSSTYALDFSGTDVPEAYIATSGSETTVTMEKVTGTVAAGTGLVLKGDADTYYIPVVASGTDYSATNRLWAITSNQNVTAAGTGWTNYVLAKQNDNVVFAPVTGENSVAVTAGHAALCLANPSGARAVSMVFDGEATGIDNLTPALSEGEGVVYNLRGQRVAQPTKGLYIVNGKKVVIK